MEDLTKPDMSSASTYSLPDGRTWRREGENWVLQPPTQLEDVGKGAAAGLGTGTWKAITSIPGVADAGLAGAQWLAGKESPLGGDIGRLREDYTYPATYEGSEHLLKKAFPFTGYEPQTTLGNIAKTGADIAPSAMLGVLGEGAAAGRYGPAAVRAALGTAGGGIGGGVTHDNAPLIEGPAEAAGMVLGMGGPAGVRAFLKPPKGGVVEKLKNLGSKTAEHLGPAAAMGTAGALLGSKYGHPGLGADIGALSGYLGGGPVMKAGGELVGAVGKAVTPKAITQPVSNMVKALSKKNLYNTKGIDPVTAAAVLAGQGEPMIGPP